MVKQWFIRFEKKKWKISYMWEFLIFFFTYVPYPINYPLLYSLTSIIPLKCMEFHFSLSVTITDFCLPRHSTQMLSLTQKNLPKVKISPKFSEYTCTFTNAFSLSFLEFMVPWGLCGQGSGVISQGSGLHF